MKVDRLARTKFRMPSIVLMENAGRLSAEEILRLTRKGKVLVICGKGNNAGDGLVCARYIKNSGAKVDVLFARSKAKIKSPETLANLSMAKALGIRILRRIPRRLSYSVIVDAIFGIGFRGSLPADVAKSVNFLNRSGIPIIALDVPSGLDATTGRSSGACVRAKKTITFGLLKTGFRRKGSGKYTGRVIVKDIGLPRQLLK